MSRRFLVFLLPTALALSSCSKNSDPDKPPTASSDFHTESSAYVRKGKDAWTYVTRYIGFGYSVLDKKSQLPQLQYGTDKEVLQRFSIVSTKQYYEAPQVFLADGTKVEKSLNRIGEPKSFSIVLKYDNGTQLLIPSRLIKFTRTKQNCRMAILCAWRANETGKRVAHTSRV